jgi:glycosyltransferase involved in cell wall biosynthesis
MCYSPPRYLWGMADVYIESANALTRVVARACIPRLREWDHAAAQKVSYFVADSANVQERIKRYYGRESTVIYPPVATFQSPRQIHRGDYYLVVGQLVPYKRADLAVLAAGRLGRRLVVIGEGPEMPRLKKLAGSTVNFLGWQSDAVVRAHMASCRALLFPGEEDFGIVPVEAQMAGRPVIAFRKGGALETVIDGRTGVFFDHQDSECLAEAMVRFERMETEFSVEDIRCNALRFSREMFMETFGEFVRQIGISGSNTVSEGSCVR